MTPRCLVTVSGIHFQGKTACGEIRNSTFESKTRVNTMLSLRETTVALQVSRPQGFGQMHVLFTLRPMFPPTSVRMLSTTHLSQHLRGIHPPSSCAMMESLETRALSFRRQIFDGTSPVLCNGRERTAWKERGRWLSTQTRC